MKSFSLEVEKKEEGTLTVVNLNAQLTDTKGNVKTLNKFNNKIKVDIPYTLKEGDDQEKITVMFVDNGKETNMTARYDSDSK